MDCDIISKTPTKPNPYSTWWHEFPITIFFFDIQSSVMTTTIHAADIICFNIHFYIVTQMSVINESLGLCCRVCTPAPVQTDVHVACLIAASVFVYILDTGDIVSCYCFKIFGRLISKRLSSNCPRTTHVLCMCANIWGASQSWHFAHWPQWVPPLNHRADSPSKADQQLQCHEVNTF